jgi:serine/threonine protein kinase
MQISVVFEGCPDVEHTIVLQRLLGQGKFYVYHAKILNMEADFALKVFSKSPTKTRHYRQEKKFLSLLNHSNTISCVPILKHNLPYNMLLTEYSPNGDFFDFVTQGGMCNEKMVRTYFHQLMDGIEYLHAVGVAHLDIKLENLLLDKDYCLKIIDFDQAQSTEDDVMRSGGTDGYRAPEVIQKKCKDLPAADIYGAGVLLYAFALEELPFVEEKKENVKDTKTYSMFKNERENFWKEKEKYLGKVLNKEFKDLLSGMWEENTDLRLKVDDIKRTRWYNGEVYTMEELKYEVRSILGMIRGI